MTGVSIIHTRFVQELNLGACEEQIQTSFVNFEICFTIKTFRLQCQTVLELIGYRLTFLRRFSFGDFMYSQASSKFSSKSHSNCSSEGGRERERSPVGSSISRGSSPYSRHSNFSPRSHRSKSYNRSRDSSKRGLYYFNNVAG